MTRLELNNQLKAKGIYFTSLEIYRGRKNIEYVYEDDEESKAFIITINKESVEIEMRSTIDFNPQLLRLIADLAELIAIEDRVNYSEVLEQ